MEIVLNGGLGKIMLSWKQPHFDRKLDQFRQQICCAATFNPLSLEGTTVQKVIGDVKNRGNEAVIEYTRTFDDTDLTAEQFRITVEDLKSAHDQLAPDILEALRNAIENVRQYQRQIFTGKDIPGKIRYTPIERIGVCVPGASAPLPSTVIMAVVPAQIAGVKQIAVISPPRHNGTIGPSILAVCYELGIEEVYRIGGVQAVAALAFGTETIEPVDKIVGPGNTWVQTAKQLVFGQVDIDSIAGPSEVIIIATSQANPAWVAADILSQAEHDSGSGILFTDSQNFAESVLTQLRDQLGQLSRSRGTEKCLKQNSRIVVFMNIDNAIEWANKFAAEHLQIQCGGETAKVLEKIKNAGAIFLGDYSPVAVGDYYAGPSHIIPTGSSARFSSALTCNDFVKSSSIIEYTKEMLAESAADILRIANIEGLDAHANSVRIRQQQD